MVQTKARGRRKRNRLIEIHMPWVEAPTAAKIISLALADPCDS